MASPACLQLRGQPAALGTALFLSLHQIWKSSKNEGFTKEVQKIAKAFSVYNIRFLYMRHAILNMLSC